MKHILKCISCGNYSLKNKFDYAVMIHGDNQYNPKYITRMIKIFEKNKLAQAVVGSRLLKGIKNSVAKNMPFYKFIGNIILTKIQNFLLGTKLSEFHSGYRSYKIDALKKINFENEILLLLQCRAMRILR